MFSEFEAQLAALPRVAFRRSREKLEISFASTALNAKEWEERCNSLDIFCRALPEVIEALGLFRARLASTDLFDVEAFLAHCRARSKEVPTSEEGFLKMLEYFREADAK
jgi:hypothetical protein